MLTSNIHRLPNQIFTKPDVKTEANNIKITIKKRKKRPLGEVSLFLRIVVDTSPQSLVSVFRWGGGGLRVGGVDPKSSGEVTAGLTWCHFSTSRSTRRSPFTHFHNEQVGACARGEGGKVEVFDFFNC